MTAGENFNSPIFGTTREATEDELAAIGTLVDAVPVAVFQALNRKLNTLGLLIVIDAKESSH